MTESIAAGMGSRLRICHVARTGLVGGVESVIRGLATGLSDRGHDVTVLSLEDPSAPIDAFRGIAGRVRVEMVPAPARRYLSHRRSLAVALAAAGAEIVHTHGYHADVVGIMAASGLGRPVVSTAHGFAGGSARNRLYEWIDRRCLRHAETVVAVSKPLVERLARSGVDRARIRLIPNGLSTGSPPASREAARQALGLPPDGLVCGWVGRLSEEKGPDVFVRALPLVPKAWRASIVGSGPMGDRLRDEADALGVTDRIRWHGVVPEAGRLLAAFDVLVLSSRTEGTPMVVLEAMAARVPLVVTAVGGVPDVVNDQEAILVAPDAPEALAAAIASVSDRPEVAKSRVDRASQRLAADFSASAWLDRHESVYRRLSPIRS